MPTPVLRLPGAVEGVAPDAGAPAHYGRPLPEQRALDRGRAVVDCAQYGVVRLTGPDRLEWLESLSSQLLPAGGCAETLLLSPQGRIEHQLFAVDDGTATHLVTEGGSVDELIAWLRRMRFMKRVEIDDVSDELHVVATIAPGFDDPGLELGAAAPNGAPLVWVDPWPTGVPGGANSTPLAEDAHPGRAFRLRLHLLDTAAWKALAARVRAGELEAAGSLALEALRVAAWRPRFARDVDDRSLPHELDLLRSAVHLSKGCYRGQETVAKVHNLGHPPRRLALLDIDGIDGRLPAHGALVHLADDPDGRPVGRIGSIALHYDEGPIALAMLKRGVDPEAALLVDLEPAPVVAGVEPSANAAAPDPVERLDARQTVIVRPDAGANVSVPRGRRRRR